MHIYKCSHCGPSILNSRTWCNLGCGKDYNKMTKVDMPIDRSFWMEVLKGCYDPDKTFHFDLALDAIDGMFQDEVRIAYRNGYRDGYHDSVHDAHLLEKKAKAKEEMGK